MAREVGDALPEGDRPPRLRREIQRVEAIVTISGVVGTSSVVLRSGIARRQEAAMQRLMARAVTWGAVVVAMSGTVGHAAGWAAGLFAEKGHHFGPVPRGAKVRHPFVLTNRLAEPVSIVDVRASCGCTVGRPSASIVAPGGSAIVETEMDTRNFTARKATTLIVTVRTASGR